ncbi:MAG: hypothetical protein CMI26_01525 [Opitutae bacterium]|nr:hypothetical protein [Opitutae bacterium]|tara:strand:- start:2728 stop:3630 length:903 start_codon:yes stop_codon:yes gene_type:complete
MLLTKLFSLLIDRSPRQLYQYVRLKLKKKTLLNYGDTDLLKKFDEKRPCVFVLSTGRTGTQTLARLLNLVDNVFAYHEPSPQLTGISKLSYEHSDNDLVSEVILETFFSLRMELLTDALSFEKGYIETSPEGSFLAPIILKAVPNVKFIHVVRDPRYVVRSAMRRNWYSGNPDDRNRIICRTKSPMGENWETLDSFQKNVWLWAETNRWICDFTSSLPQNRKLLIRSEDIFNTRDEEMDKLFSFLGSSLPPHRKISSIIGKKLNRQESGSFPKVADWSDCMHTHMRKIAGGMAEDFGYKV